MYPSNINDHSNSILDQTMPYYYKPSLSDQNLNLAPSSFFNSPPPYNIDYEDELISQYLFQHHQQQQHQPLTPEASPRVLLDKSHDKDNKLMSPLVEQNPMRKRSGYKKDRHSKIETAQGPRDRRMRLSLEVAREFFNLQDLLGFDKASKTVGWLLNVSKTEIEELKRTFPNPHGKKNSCSVGGNNYSANSSTSECEVVSGTIDESAVDGNWHGGRKGKGGKNVRAILRKSAFDPIARESRDKARARARERTRVKKKLDESSKLPFLEGGVNHQNDSTNRLGTWSRFESSTGQHHLDLLADHVEDLSSSGIFNHNNGIGIGVSEENHFTDFQVYGKPWEAFNNINLCKQSPNVFFGDLSGQD